MDGQFRKALRERLGEALAQEFPERTRREVRLPGIPGKVHAVVGLRRAGKTTFLRQCLRERLAAGAPRESLLHVDFGDERLAGMTAPDLGDLVEEYFTLCPQFRGRTETTFIFDGIQAVPGWETFVRRLHEEERARIFVSGSSARLLGREVATALRGRAMETLVFPFSFREALTHRGIPLPEEPRAVPRAERSRLESAFRAYREQGGFPEAQGAAPEDRIRLLQSTVDACLFRDVVERHRVGNVAMLRALVRRLLASPAGRFSVRKVHDEFRSRGLAGAKEDLYAMLAHLEDAFLIRTSELADASGRRRQVNPRKVYPVDPGLIAAFDPALRTSGGASLETIVRIELERRHCRAEYVVTPEGHEVDFLAVPPQGRSRLIQVCDDLEDPAAREREIRALVEARREFRGSSALILAGRVPRNLELPAGIEVRLAWEWLLDL
jgi:hypothetical protein